MRVASFRDRVDAGRQLATRLTEHAHRPDVLVLALPRGGVPVAYEVAWALDAPLDIFLVRKLGVPGHEEVRELLARSRRETPGAGADGSAGPSERRDP
jgi:predicted phosphoribosyltransferase